MNILKRIALLVLFCILAVGCSASAAVKCAKCGKSYTDESNKISISKNNMCTACYSLYKNADNIKGAAIGDALDSYVK